MVKLVGLERLISESCSSLAVLGMVKQETMLSEALVSCSSLAVLGMVKPGCLTKYDLVSCSSLAVLGMVKQHHTSG